ncbi:MAG: starch-binding protein, partial [Dysgonamonadaceae bacterium]|nr:starch-binding protein [Dysgonamonadaceae bacterium]
YGAMTWKDGSTSRPAGLIHGSQSRRYAVTFVDNHDTYRDGSKYTGDVLKAYAFILSSPGIPCVFYPHWTANKATINSMISARKAVGLHSESNVEVQNTSGYYKAYSVGTCGEMLTYIGSWSEDPTKSGYTRACYGSGWAMYTKVTSTSCGNEHQQGIDNGQNPNQGTKFTSITITATVPAAWTAPKIHVWNKGVAGAPQITKAAWPGDAMTSLGNNTWTITLSGFAETNEVGIVFNDGKASGAAQTIDLSTNKTPTCWILSATASTGGKFDATEDPNCGTLATGISDVEQENRIVLYPNPVENELRLFTGQSLVFAEIRTLSGQAIKSSTEKQIQVADLKAGMYLLMVYTTDGSVQTLKFIKK